MNHVNELMGKIKDIAATLTVPYNPADKIMGVVNRYHRLLGMVNIVAHIEEIEVNAKLGIERYESMLAFAVELKKQISEYKGD